ncbi:MAG: hypothetical protein H0X39_09650 [Actinobacteria bacterium]|nr:hypothetical protein [Actinomycetota bacterium]
MFEDLLKLHAVHEGRRALLPLVSGMAADLSDDGTTLTFRSIRQAGEAERGPLPFALHQMPERLTWDHRELGTRARLPVWLHRQLHLSLAPSGIHEFPALIEIGTAEPSVVIQAITSLELTNRERIRLDPRNYIAKSALLVRALLNPHLRSIAGEWLRSPRNARGSGSTLAAELVELFVLDQAMQGSLPSIPGVEIETRDGVLVATSTRSRTSSQRLDLGGVRSITWDNRALGPNAWIPSRFDRDLHVAIGEDGHSTYPVTAALAQPVDREAATRTGAH